MADPAAPLEKAVEEAREALARHRKASGGQVAEGCKCVPCRLERLLAALDADKSGMEKEPKIPFRATAEMTPRERAQRVLIEVPNPYGGPPLNALWIIHLAIVALRTERHNTLAAELEAVSDGVYEAMSARRYFAEKGER